MRFQVTWTTLLVVLCSSALAQQQPNPYYVALLNDSLWFYEAQRSGYLVDSRVFWYKSRPFSRIKLCLFMAFVF